MSSEAAFKALENAMERCAALQAEMSKVPAEDRGRLMRAYELLDLLELALIKAGKELEDIK